MGRKKTSFNRRKPKQQNDIKMKFLISFLLLIALMATSEAFFLGGSNEETTTTAQPEPVGDDDNNDDEDEDDKHDDDEDDNGVSNEDLAKLLHKLLSPAHHKEPSHHAAPHYPIIQPIRTTPRPRPSYHYASIQPAKPAPIQHALAPAPVQPIVTSYRYL